MSSPALELNTDLRDVRHVCFSPDGQSIACVGYVGHVCYYTLSPAVQLKRYHPGQAEPLGPMYGVAFSPDGRKLAAATWSGPLLVWDLSAENAQYLLPGHRYSANRVLYSPSGEELFSSGNDGRIKVWDASVPKKRARVSVKAHSELVYAIAVSSDGRTFAWGGGTDGRSLGAWVLDLNSREEVAIDSGHQDDVAAVAFSPCSSILASGSWDNTVKLFDVASGKEVAKFTTPQNTTVNSVGFSPDGKLLVAGGHGGHLYLWNVEERELVRSWHAHEAILWCCLFSPTGDDIASCGCDGKVRLWDTKSILNT